MKQYESFRHSLVASKIWLCAELEKAIDTEIILNAKLNILASWDNLLAFMLIIRNPNKYGVINSYDHNVEHVEMADYITDCWKYEYPKVYNYKKDINTLNFYDTDRESVFINCSVDQINNTSWYNTIPEDRLVVLQCTDLPVNFEGWDIVQSHDLEGLTKTYPCKKIIYSGTKSFDYGHLKYNRHMIIGIK